MEEVKTPPFQFPQRLVCRAAAVQKAARFWYKKTFQKSGELNPPWKAAMENNKVRQHSFTVSPEEYRSAVTTLVQWVQTESFPREIVELAKGKIVKKAKIARLSSCLINGTINLPQKSHSPSQQGFSRAEDTCNSTTRSPRHGVTHSG
ncbi:hypothetical protein LAZ67_20000643 [Cordylochernes scorpioides]|uniref:Uncharacterized protein n=1 Tax=Cordylochernes scorpioides TaxID=51811 RepID=A0ABY6LJB3_9ARAC|nr:hypothetical protein LAZ67_20000643 [Cordylochernes scorpioides]